MYARMDDPHAGRLRQTSSTRLVGQSQCEWPGFSSAQVETRVLAILLNNMINTMSITMNTAMINTKYFSYRSRPLELRYVSNLTDRHFYFSFLVRHHINHETEEKSAKKENTLSSGKQDKTCHLFLFKNGSVQKKI